MIGSFLKKLFKKKEPQGVPSTFAVRDASQLVFDTNPDAWRKAPALTKFFTHPDHPDKIQIVIHAGGYKFTAIQPELVWVRITGRAGVCYSAELLSKPIDIPNLQPGQSLLFMAPNGGPQPHMIDARYIADRANWRIIPCEKCGMHEFFDPPTDFFKKTFPNLTGDIEEITFTAFCNLCKGVQVVVKG